MWYIWKARNDYHFNRKQWTPAQVHHAAAAHMSSYSAAFHPSGVQVQAVFTAGCPNSAHAKHCLSFDI